MGPFAALLREAVTDGVPVLGICFGAQALAVATGGEVRRNPRPEIGWHRVDSEVDAVAREWFQWHKDGFTVGPEASLVGKNDVGQQTFTVGRSLGVQFHPEIDSTHLEYWLAGGGATDMESDGVDPEAVLADTRSREVGLYRQVSDLVHWFLEDVAGH